MTSNASPWAQRIKTNYVPLPHEVNRLKNIVDKEMTKVHIIDEEINHLHNRLSDLDARRSSQMKRVQEYQALLTPARGLPVEILGKIFLSSLEAYLQDSPSSRMGKHPGKALSHVCRLWREIAIGLPALWSVIDIWLPNHPSRFLRKRYGMAPAILPNEEGALWMNRIEGWKQRIRSIGDMLELYLARSGTTPLTIAFSAKEACPYPIDDEKLLIERLVSTITRSYPRLENVIFKFKIEDFSSPFVRLVVVDPQDIPSLRRARLNIKLGDALEEGDPEDKGLRFQGPNLTSLILDMRWYYVRIVQSGFDWASLVELNLCTIGQEDLIPPDVYSTMEILRQCPKLVRCALEFQHDTFGSLPDHERTELYPITLPYLRDLRIHGHGVHLFMSRALNLPLLEDVAILDIEHNPYNGEEAEIPDGIVPWAEKYGQQLKNVAFEYGFLSQSQFLRTLSNLKVAVSLKLNGVVDYAKAAPDQYVDDEAWARWAPPARLGNDVLRMLTPTFNETKSGIVGECFCPRLRRMECTTGDLDFNELGFVEFVAARRMVDKVVGSEISLIEEVILRFTSPRRIDFEGELERRGVEANKFGLRVESQ